VEKRRSRAKGSRGKVTMRVLCTGAAGYIGSIVTNRLLSEGHDVIALDDLSQGHRDTVSPGARFIKANVCDLGELLSLLEEPIYAVIHLASLASVEESRREPLRYYTSNGMGILNLAQAIAMSRCRCERVVFASSCSVYGNSLLALEDETLLAPASPYAESKAAAEKVLFALRQQHGAGVGVLRLFNVAGAASNLSAGERHDPETHLIPKILQAVLRNEPFAINGHEHNTVDGTCVRDYVHVDDVVSAILALLSDLNPGDYRVYNVGSGMGTSVNEMVEVVRSVTGRSVCTTTVAHRPGDPDYVVASTAKIVSELGWCPRRSTGDMVRSAWAFMLKNL